MYSPSNKKRQSKKNTSFKNFKQSEPKSKLNGGNPPYYLPTTVIPTSLSKKPISFLKNPILYLHENILYLNNSKFFAGVVMILLNIGSKFITVEFSKSTEEYLKYTLSKQVLIFAMAWMASRDIYTALIITAVFVVLSENLFNEDSQYCIVPHSNRVLKQKIEEAIDVDNSGIVTAEELNNAIAILEKAKMEKQQNMDNQSKQINTFMK
jgi:hypothetical protein